MGPPTACWRAGGSQGPTRGPPWIWCPVPLFPLKLKCCLHPASRSAGAELVLGLQPAGPGFGLVWPSAANQLCCTCTRSHPSDARVASPYAQSQGQSWRWAENCGCFWPELGSSPASIQGQQAEDP